MDIKVGDIFLDGSLIRVKKQIIRIEKIRKSKVKYSVFDPSLLKKRQKPLKPYPSGKLPNIPFYGTPWLYMDKWVSISSLELIPLTTMEMLEL